MAFVTPSDVSGVGTLTDGSPVLAPGSGISWLFGADGIEIWAAVRSVRTAPPGPNPAAPATATTVIAAALLIASSRCGEVLRRCLGGGRRDTWVILGAYRHPAGSVTCSQCVSSGGHELW